MQISPRLYVSETVRLRYSLTLLFSAINIFGAPSAASMVVVVIVGSFSGVFVWLCWEPLAEILIQNLINSEGPAPLPTPSLHLNKQRRKRKEKEGLHRLNV